MFFFFKQKTAYEMRISDWSSDVCSSDLRGHPGVRHLLVEKTDRLYRNIKDWVTLDGFDIELHLVKEGTVLSRDSRSSEKFMHGIKVLMAKNYVDNLSEEARKGMLDKTKQGIYPSQDPLGRSEDNTSKHQPP